MKRSVLVLLFLGTLPATQGFAEDKPLSAARPTPVTRPEMKRLLEDMKQRKPRIPIPELTAEEQEKTEADPRSRGYEGRLRSVYMPRSTPQNSLGFSGSPRRPPGSDGARREGNRSPAEQDPAVTLDYGFKTKLFWIASRANNCQYCLGHQESKLLAVGMTDDDLAALDSDWSHFPASEQVAFALARRLTLEPHLLCDADIDRCREFFTDVQILEMALSVAGNNAINRWKEGTGVPQSAGGGNFGRQRGSDTPPAENHSYLTETNVRFQNVASRVIPVSSLSAGQITVATTLDRGPRDTPEAIERGLTLAASRPARLPLVADEQVRATFKDLAPTGPIPGWMRLLGNFPVIGPRTAASVLGAESQSDLSPLLRAQIAWTIARQDRAWYALGEARQRLRALGQSDAQIFALESAEPGVNDADRSLLTLARNLAASPVILTDEQVAEAVRLAGPRDVVQTIHYTTVRAQFDRFTEAAGLPLDP